MTWELIILAMIAAFLGLRLYSVLGRRTGHEQEPMAPRPLDRPLDRAQDRPQDRNDGQRSNPLAPIPSRPDLGLAPRPSLPSHVDMRAESGLRAIMAQDRRFDANEFIDGAKAAYGMILDAFWKGDRADLRSLCDDDVYASFEAALDERAAAGEVLDNRLVRIDSVRITDAELNGALARITVRFDADIAAVVRNADGEMIAGSMDDAVETHDIWTFSRDMRSRDPDWLLDETDQA